MREWLRFHSPAVGAFLALTVVAGALSLAMPVPTAAQDAGSPLPVQSIPLPAPGNDRDRDSYADDVDLAFGDLQVGLRLMELHVPGSDAEPYVLLGTDDDHWRTGAGDELEWRHIIDPDSLGHDPGSPGWQESVIRTGEWWMSRPADGEDIAIAKTGTLGPNPPNGAHWPQTLWANTRDDRGVLRLHVELRDSATKPHAVRGTWMVEVDALAQRIRMPQGEWQTSGAGLRLTEGASSLLVNPTVSTGLSLQQQQNITKRWAPTLRLDSEEVFAPTSGALMERYHGFTRLEPGAEDLRTWDFGFNSGRDGYRLFLADFNGDGDTDHLDAQIMADLLGEGDLGAPTVNAYAAMTTDGQVVVQYWFLYFFNFVLDESGNDVDKLQHKGDREFIQLTFDSPEAAMNGTPTAIAFSQHYAGLLVVEPDEQQMPFEDGRFIVHIARGSHATYPAPGDDRRLRSSLTSLFDRFDGQGRELDPGNYTLQLIGDQPWHAGYKWGPVTRYTRDLGTSSRPFLQHDFRYPFTDPLWWQANLETVTPDDLERMYGRAS